ncbi:MAG: YgjV family protein, partial [Nanoarchaeota archaeon]|nr:YgjV family protein [Nanoarchaeota archaeon]
FTTNKKYSYIFIFLNTLTVIFTYTEIYDLIIYAGVTIFIIGNFQKNKKLMRKQMMFGTSLLVVYYIIIFSPVAILAEILFLTSAVIGYYRHYIRKNIKS